ncbi:MAG TPA: DEAD/DEAH box helicase, partial [Solirubrobacteraceae bacterium]|nr:DEAD/DEAH box helicase [Solirubrobacteraceae bacterium]
REQVLAEGIPGGFSILYDALSQLETLGVCRRGYFVEGLGGAQFALPGAVERLRAQRAVEESAPLVLAATDPAQPYGAALPWPQRDSEQRRPARVRGAYVVLAGAEPVLYVEKGGRGIVTLVEPGDPRLRPSFEALAQFVTGGRGRKLSLERVDGEPVVGSPHEAMLVELGFRPGPSKLTLSA